MTEDQFWTTEAAFWTGGREHCAKALHPDALMVFPPPAGIMTADAALEGLDQAPRWQAVALTQRHCTRPCDEVAVLAYRAEGKRDGSAPYRAVCSSSYVRHAETRDWRLVAHQQTPLD